MKEIIKPNFEDRATNYFQDEPGCKAGIQLQRDIWNEFVEPLKSERDHFADGVDKAIIQIKAMKTLLNECADFILNNQTDETEDCSEIVKRIRAKSYHTSVKEESSPISEGLRVDFDINNPDRVTPV